MKTDNLLLNTKTQEAGSSLISEFVFKRLGVGEEIIGNDNSSKIPQSIGFSSSKVHNFPIPQPVYNGELPKLSVNSLRRIPNTIPSPICQLRRSPNTTPSPIYQLRRSPNATPSPICQLRRSPNTTQWSRSAFRNPPYEFNYSISEFNFSDDRSKTIITTSKK